MFHNIALGVSSMMRQGQKIAECLGVPSNAWLMGMSPGQYAVIGASLIMAVSNCPRLPQ